MSFFDAPTHISGDDTIAPEQAAPAPKLGFLDGMDTAYRATTEATNQLALDYQFQKNEADQIRAVRQAGGSVPDGLGDSADAGSFPYRNVARFYQSGGAGDDDGAMANAIGSRNAKMMELQKQYPQLNLKTYDQMWADTQKNAQELTTKLAQDPTSVGGSIGEFIGGSIGGLSPRTNPLPFATLGVPMGELGVLARAGVQAASGASADALGQLTGGDERQQLLGVGDGSFNLGQSIEAGAGAAAGEFGLHAFAHGAGVVARKLNIFPDHPTPVPPKIEPTGPDVPGVRYAQDPANMRLPDDLPKISPLDNYEVFRQGLADYTKEAYGSSRLAEAMGQLDVAGVHKQLDDWHGPEPWEVAPRTDTAAPPDVTHMNYGKPLTKLLEGEGPETIARRIDPQTFSQIDKLSAQMDQGRAELQRLAAERDSGAKAHVADLDKQIAAAQAVADAATGKRRAPAQRALEDLQGQREQKHGAFLDARGGSGDSPQMATVRAQLMKLDEQQRDLAPLVSRAFSAAENKWSEGRYNPDTIRFLRDLEQHPRRRWKDNEPIVQPEMLDPRPLQGPGRDGAPLTRPGVSDIIPELKQRPDIVDKMPDAPLHKQVTAVLEANAKDLEPEIEKFQSQVSKLLSEGAEDNTIRLNGVDLHLDNDTMTVPTADGEGTKQVSLRSYLQDLQNDHEELKAISSCRISS